MKPIRTTASALAAIVTCHLGLCGLAHGQSPASGSAWQFGVAPYLWAAGIKGTLATLPSAPAADVDFGFNDILKNLDLGFMMLAEARNDRFVALLDLTWTQLGGKADTPGTPFSSVKLVSTVAFGALTGGYRVVSEPGGFIEPFVGGRLWYLETKVKLKDNTASSRKGSESEVWFDPIVGVRAQLNLGSHVFLAGYADVGGFGVGADLTWQVYGGAGYQFSSSWAAFAGYRYLSVDYSKDGFVYDIDQHGPMLGVTYRF